MLRLLIIIVLLATGFYVVWPALTGYRIYQSLEAREPTVLAAKVDFPSVRRSMRGPVLQQVDQRIGSVVGDLGPSTKGLADRIPRTTIERIVDGALARVVTPEKVAEIYASSGSFNRVIKDAVVAEIDALGGIAKAFGFGTLLGAGSGPASNNGKDGASIGGLKLPGGLGGLLGNKDVGNLLGGLAEKLPLDTGQFADKLFPDSKVVANGVATDKAGNGSDGGRSISFDSIESIGLAGPLTIRVKLRGQSAGQPGLTTDLEFKNYDWRVTAIVPDLAQQ